MDLSADLALVANFVGAVALDFLPRLAAALVLLVVGYLVARWLGSAVERALLRTGRLEATLIPVMTATVRYATLIVVVIAALAQLGLQTTSLLAALGAAGLAIGLALQGTLQNIAAGLMLLWLRPFRAGDFIEAPAVSGTVEEVGLFASRFRTADGIYRFVPNSELWNKTLTNYSRNPTRQMALPFAIPYDQDLAEARRLLEALAEAHPKVLKVPPVEVVPLALGETAVTLELRVWTLNADFWPTRWDLIEKGKATLAAAGVPAPVPRLVRVSGGLAEAEAPASA